MRKLFLHMILWVIFIIIAIIILIYVFSNAQNVVYVFSKLGFDVRYVQLALFWGIMTPELGQQLVLFLFGAIVVFVIGGWAVSFLIVELLGLISYDYNTKTYNRYIEKQYLYNKNGLRHIAYGILNMLVYTMILFFGLFIVYSFFTYPQYSFVAIIGIYSILTAANFFLMFIFKKIGSFFIKKIKNKYAWR